MPIIQPLGVLCDDLNHSMAYGKLASKFWETADLSNEMCHYPFIFALHRSSTLVLLVLWHSVWSAMHPTASVAQPRGPRRRVAPAGAGRRLREAGTFSQLIPPHPTSVTPSPRLNCMVVAVVALHMEI